MGANFFSNQQNSLYHRNNDDSHNFDSLVKTRKRRRTNEEECINLPLKTSLSSGNAQVSINNDQQYDKLESISNPVDFNLNPSSHRSKRQWSFYKKLKEDVFSKNKHYSKPCGKHMPALNKSLNKDKSHNVSGRVKLKKRLYKPINDKLFDTPRSIKSFALQPYAKIYRINRDMNRGQLTDPNGKTKSLESQVCSSNNKKDINIQNMRNNRSKNESKSIETSNSVEGNDFLTQNSEACNKVLPKGDILPKMNSLLDQKFIRNLNISSPTDSKVSPCNFSRSDNNIVLKQHENNLQSLVFNHFSQNRVDQNKDGLGIAKEDGFQEFKSDPKCINTINTRKKRSSFYDSPDQYDDNIFDDNRSKDDYQLELGLIPNSFELLPGKTINSNIDIMDSAETADAQEKKTEIITRNRKAIPLSSLFSKTYVQSLKNYDQVCNVSDIIFPTKVGNTIVFRNCKISPIRSTDKFSYYNGTVISGSCLVKKSNYSVCQLTKIPVFLKTPKPSVALKDSLLQNSSISSGAMSVCSNDTSRKNRTNGFFTKMISYMKSKVSDTEVPTDKCVTIKVDKDVYYDIGKDLPLIAKSQDFQFSNGTIINGGALLKKAKYSKSKLKDILFMEYESLYNNKGTNKSSVNTNASSVLNVSEPLTDLEITTKSMEDQERYQNESEFRDSVTISDKNLANISERIIPDNMNKSSTCDYQGLSVSYPVQSLEEASESAFSQKLPTDMMIGSFNRSSTTCLPLSYSTSNIASISSDKILPVEPDVFKQKESTKIDKHQPTLLNKLLPVQEAIKNKSSTEVHRVPRTTSLRTLSEPLTTDISKAGFIQITPILKNLGVDRSTQGEQNHSDMSTSQFVPTQSVNFNQDRTMQEQLLISTTIQVNPSSERTISNSINNASMDDQLRASQNYLLTSLNSLSSDHEEIVTLSSMANEGFSVLNDDDKNLVTDDKLYTSLADSRIATIDQQESNVGSLATSEDNFVTSSLQIDTPLETESSSILLSTEPLLETSSPSLLSKETETNIILTSEISDISSSKENLQPNQLDTDRSLSSDQAIQQSYENSTLVGELVKLVDKLIIEHMFSTTDSSYLSTEPESQTSVYSSEQPRDMFPCLLDKLQNKDFYLINTAKNNLNDKFSAWHLHHTDQAVPGNLYFLEQSNENDPNLLEHKNRTVYRLDHSGYDYYFCPSHPNQVFLIQRDHENKNLTQQNYLHFVDMKNDNLPIKHFHYLENSNIFHDADHLASDDNNSSMPDTNFYILDPNVEKSLSHVCSHPYCHVHHITPSNEVSSNFPSNLESDQYYTHQPSEITLDHTDLLESNKLNNETKEDDHKLYEPKDTTFLETDETRHHLFPYPSEGHNHPEDPLNEDLYYIIDDKTENSTCPLDRSCHTKCPYKHCCHHHINNQEGQVNQLSCPNRHYSYIQHSNEKNYVEPLSKSNEERRGHCSFNEQGVGHGMIHPRDDLRPLQDYKNRNHYKQADTNSFTPLGNQMLQKNIQNDYEGLIRNQDQIHQLENSNLDIESRQIGPLKDNFSSSDRQQQGVYLISKEQQNKNSGTTKNKDSKEVESHTLQNEDNSIYSDNLLPSEKLSEDNSLQSEKSNEDNTLQSEKSNEDDTLLSEKSNQENSPLSEKLNEENNLYFEDNSVRTENSNESSRQSENTNKSNSLHQEKSNEESFLHTEKLNEGDSFLSDKSKEDNSLLTQKVNEENTFHTEVPKVGNHLLFEKGDEINLPQLENISNNAFDVNNPLQNNFQQPEKLNNDYFLQSNNTNDGLYLYSQVDSTNNCSLENADSGVMRCPHCQRQYIPVQLIGTDQCHCQNHHQGFNNMGHSVNHMKHPCKNCGIEVPNWYAMAISYSNNKNRTGKHAKVMKIMNNEEDSKYNVDETDETSDLRIDGNDLISEQSQLLEEKRKIKANEANVSSVFGMVSTEMDPNQKIKSNISSSISLDICSSLNESPIDLLESPFERQTNDRGVMHYNFQGSIEKPDPQGANRDLGRPGYCGKADLIENSITHIKNGKDFNSYIKKIEPNSISSQSKSSFEKFNKTLNSLVVQKNTDVLTPQNISLINAIKAKGKNASLKQDKACQIPSRTNLEKWYTFVLNKNNGSLSHTPLKVPLVLSDDGRTVWTLHDYLLETQKNPLLSQKNAYYYIYDSLTPLGSQKNIKLLNGSTVLQGDLIKEANYSYSAFLGLLNVKADLQLNIDPDITSKQCIDVILVRQPCNTNNDGSVHGHSSGIFMAEDGKKAKYYTDSKDMFLQDKLLHESIFLPTNKTTQPSKNKTNLSNQITHDPSNYFHQSQEQSNPSILKIIGLPGNNQLKDYSVLIIKACNQRVKNPGIYSPVENQKFIPITIYNQERKGPSLLKFKYSGPDGHSQHKNKYDPIELEDRVSSS